MIFLNSIASAASKKRLKQLYNYNTEAMQIQQKQLFLLLNEAKKTEWGKKYDYASIRSIKQFQNTVPLQYYTNVKPFIDRLIAGETNILWPGKIKWFAKSSGTTADKSKYIPITETNLKNCHYRGGKDIITLYLSLYPKSKLLIGKALGIGGSQNINALNNNSYIGDLSAILISNLPYWVEFIRTPNSAIALMDNWNEKITKLVKITQKVNVTSIAGVPSWTLVFLQHLIKTTGKQNISEIWNNLELFIHGGVCFTPYKDVYKNIMPPTMRYFETYNASEGFFALQNDPTTNDLLLMLDYGIFYEFIAMDDIEKSYPTTYTLEEVELGKNYAMVISTNSGLWRYIIGDTVKFTSKNPYKIIISGRTKHFINAFGEEVIIENADKALQYACNKTNSSIREYTAAPVYMNQNEKGTHQWLIEFITAPNNLNEFIKYLDEGLKSVNSDYEAKRKNNTTLGMPKIIVAQQGLFYKWMELKGKLGGQHKVPRLANNREYIDELIALNNNKI